MFDELNTGYSSDDVAVTEGWLDKIAMERVAAATTSIRSTATAACTAR